MELQVSKRFINTFRGVTSAVRPAIRHTIRRIILGERPAETPRVLFALPFAMLGGGDNVIYDVARYVIREGGKVHAITTIPFPPEFGDNSPRWAALATSFHRLESFLETSEEFNRFILDLIAREKINLIFIVGCEVVYHLLPEIRRRFPNVKVIDNLFNEVGHIVNNRRYSAEIDLNIVSSDKVRAALVDERGELPAKVQVITHGIDVAGAFAPHAIPPAGQLGDFSTEGRFVVSFFGRFSEEKAPRTMVSLADRFRDYTDILVALTGAGPEFDLVKSKVQELGLTGKVYLPGFVDDMRPALRRTDVLVIPSKIEGIPLILMEGLAMGIPIVASRVGGIPTMITHGENGFLCDSEDTEQFSDTILMLYRNADLRRRIGERARDFALKNIDVEVTNRAYYEAFTRIL